jgi:hypothetical protein
VRHGCRRGSAATTARGSPPGESGAGWAASGGGAVHRAGVAVGGRSRGRFNGEPRDGLRTARCSTRSRRRGRWRGGGAAGTTGCPPTAPWGTGRRHRRRTPGRRPAPGSLRPSADRWRPGLVQH